MIVYALNGLILFAIALIVVWVIRLHLDPKYENFDLTKLITQPDGSPDGEKLRMWSTYILGAYGFVHLMIRQPATFLSYAPLFLGIVFTHLVANRVTARPPLEPKP